MQGTAAVAAAMAMAAAARVTEPRAADNRAEVAWAAGMAEVAVMEEEARVVVEKVAVAVAVLAVETEAVARAAVASLAAACNSHTYKGRYPVRARLVSEGCDTRLGRRRCRMPSRRRTHRTLLTQQAAKERIGAQARLRCHCLLHRCCHRRRRSPKVEAERKEAKEEGLERRMAAVCWLLRRL